MVQFAYDTAAPDIAGKLLAILRAQPKLAWFALVDSAFDYARTPEGAPYRPYPFPEGSANCFEGVLILEDLPQIAPVLVPLPAAEAEGRIAALAGHCDGRPMLSLIGAEEGTEAGELAGLWRLYHRVYPEDGGEYVMRFADTRITAILPKFLEPGQWLAYHRRIETWTIVGRNGRLEGIPLEKPPGKKPPFKLSLSEKQFAQMVALNEADNVFAVMTERGTPPYLEKMEGSRFHYLASRMLGHADSAGIDSWPDRVALATLALSTDGKIFGDAAAMQWIQEKPWGEGKMLDAMREAPCFANWR